MTAAATLGGAALSTATPAQAQWYGGYGGYHRGWGGPGYYGPRPWYRPHPVFYGGGCVVRRRWVPGPFGFHFVARRVCY